MEKHKNRTARDWESVVATKGLHKKQDLQPTAVLIQQTKSFLNTSFLLVYKVQFSTNLHVTRDHWKTNERIFIYFALLGTTVECL